MTNKRSGTRRWKFAGATHETWVDVDSPDSLLVAALEPDPAEVDHLLQLLSAMKIVVDDSSLRSS